MSFCYIAVLLINKREYRLYNGSDSFKFELKTPIHQMFGCHQHIAPEVNVFSLHNTIIALRSIKAV